MAVLAKGSGATETPTLIERRGKQLVVMNSGNTSSASWSLAMIGFGLLLGLDTPLRYVGAGIAWLAALYLHFFKAKLVIDRPAGEVRVTRGLRARTTRIPLSDFEHVRIGRDVRGQGERQWPVYPVCLHGRQQLELIAPIDSFWAWQNAEIVARYLTLDIVNMATGKAERRSFQELDTPLVDRTRARRGLPPMLSRDRADNVGEDEVARSDSVGSLDGGSTVASKAPLRLASVGVDLQAPPPRLRGRFKLSPDALQVDLPLGWLDLHWLWPVLGALFLLMPLGACLSMFVPMRAADPVEAFATGPTSRLVAFLVVAAVGLVPILLLLRSGMRRLRCRESLHLTPRAFVLRTRLGGSTIRVESMPVAKLEELGSLKQLTGLGHGPGGVCVRSDDKQILFGVGLSNQEILWILSAVSRFLEGIEYHGARD